MIFISSFLSFRCSIPTLSVRANVIQNIENNNNNKMNVAKSEWEEINGFSKLEWVKESESINISVCKFLRNVKSFRTYVHNVQPYSTVSKKMRSGLLLLPLWCRDAELSVREEEKRKNFLCFQFSVHSSWC